ncbi:stress-response A/B barrel domain-containing protein UP3-like [Aristolochia californica]|uniref:stress-response A/B barrel domain-containing protein UP3-like n=1 Tax=Aristolochia californica TaxID=171875 RepID=UPI0035E1E620
MLSVKSLPFFQLQPHSLRSVFLSTSRSRIILSDKTTQRSPLTTVSVFRDVHFVSRSCSSSTMSSSDQVVEHLVLFAVNRDAAPSKAEELMSGLRSLVSLDSVSHLTAGPIFKNRSSSFGNFTHLLHSRYRTKSDLNSYTSDPAHIKVVKECGLPICDDIMAVDWVADLAGSAVVPRPGSAMRFTLLKPKEGIRAEEKAEIIRVVGGIKESFPELIKHVSFGENFSPARAKGFELGFISIFPGVKELEALDAEGEKVEVQKDKVRHLLESVLVVDYVMPFLSSSNI